MSKSPKITSCLVAVLLTLAACDTPEERAQEHMTRGLELVTSGDLSAALTEFRDGFRLDPTLLEARRQYAAIAAAQGNPREAIRQYLIVLDEEPDGLADLRAVADLGLRIQDQGIAEAHIERAYAIDATDAETMSIKAAVDYADPAKRDVAVVMAQSVLEDHPGNARAHGLLISEEISRGRLDSALELADSAIAVLPDDVDLHFSRLLVLERLNDKNAQADQLQRMVERFPGNPAVLNSFTGWFEANGLAAEGIEVLEALADESTGNITVALATLLNETGQQDEARRIVEEVLEGNPEHAGAVNFMSDAAAPEGVSELPWGSSAVREAIAAKLAVLEEDADNLAVHRDLAELALRIDDTALAAKHADRAHELSADDPLTLSLKAAADYRNGTEPEPAVEMAGAALQSSTALPRAHEVVIAAKFAEGDTAAALKLADAAISAIPQNVELALTRLEILRSDGNSETIDKYLRQIIQRFPTNESVSDAAVDWYAAEDLEDEAVAFIRDIDQPANPKEVTYGLRITQAKLLNEAGLQQEAAELVADILQSDPGNPYALVLEANISGSDGAENLPTDPQEIRDAISGYLSVLEDRPDSILAHTNLAELALRIGDFQLAVTHASRAFELDPDNPEIRAIKAAVDFRDETMREQALLMANGVLDETPDNLRANMVAISAKLSENDYEAALATVNTSLELLPDEESLHIVKLSILERLEDSEAVTLQLETMVDLFPGNANMRRALVGQYVGNNDPEAGEAVLRAGIDEASGPEDKLAVVQYLFELNGQDAARAELEKLVANEPEPYRFQLALADLENATGNPDRAIDYLREITEGKETSDGVRNLRTALARFLTASGSTDEAAEIIAAVLEEDPDLVAALKLRARFSIEEDRTEDAVADLRLALQGAPGDPEIFSTMAMAYQRAGSTELMGDTLAMAVRASEFGIAETVRYARFLINEDDPNSAEGVVVAALGQKPENIELLNLLGNVHMARQDWERAGQVAGILRNLDDPRGKTLADSLDAAILQAQDRGGESIALLEGLAMEGGNVQAMSELVRTHVENGDTDLAMAYINDVLADEPNNEAAKYLKAGIFVATEDLDSAADLYRELVETNPRSSRAYELLHVLLGRQGKTAEAEAVLDAGIRNATNSLNLQISKAGALEIEGDIPGAIDIYERLYDEDSSNDWVANNLASLLTWDPENVSALDRAYAIARRFRDSGNPYFQDTYGWILHLRGDPSEALKHLVPASEGIPGNPQVLYHLAEALFASGNLNEAKETYELALKAAENGNPLPQAQKIRDKLADTDQFLIDGAN